MKSSLCKFAIIVFIGFCAFLPAPALASQCADPSNCFIIRASSPSQVNGILNRHGLHLVDEAHPDKPQIFLAEGPAGVSPLTTLLGLLTDPKISFAESAQVASISEDDDTAILDSVELAEVDQSYTGVVENEDFVSDLWAGYADQPAAGIVRLPETHALPFEEARGTGQVAIIDTGVDPDHPLLQGALVTGYDFLTDQLGIPSEWSALDPATRDVDKQDLEAAADQSYTGVVEGDGVLVSEDVGTRIVVDQSYTGVVEGKDLPAAFGHGTMVAGIVRLVAPGAQIMPLRAFDGDGTGRVWDVVKAVYFATLTGADVINMSFSLDSHSEALADAINFAKLLGVVCVSSTGNQGTANLTYPAALGNVIGVASTDDQDQLSAFSNFGLGLATLAAPGEAIVTLYPGGFYAAAWGTSFSSAFVAGTVALLNEQVEVLGFPVLQTVNFALAELALQSSAYNPDPANLDDWGAGRLDARGAFDNGLLGN